MVNAATLINQTSGKTEYGTPAGIVEAARLTMDGITCSENLPGCKIKYDLRKLRFNSTDENSKSQIGKR